MPKEVIPAMSNLQRSVWLKHAGIREPFPDFLLRTLKETGSRIEAERKLGVSQARFQIWMKTFLLPEETVQFPRRISRQESQKVKRHIDRPKKAKDRQTNARIKEASRARVRKAVSDRFQNFQTLDSTITTVEEIARKAQRENPQARGVNLYRIFASRLPSRSQKQTLSDLLSGINGADFEVSARALNSFMLITLKTTLRALDSFQPSQAENNELVEVALNCVRSQAEKLSPNALHISSRLYADIYDTLERYIAKKEKMPIGWVHQRQHNLIKNEVQRIRLGVVGGAMDEAQVGSAIFDLARRTGYTVPDLVSYIKGVKPTGYDNLPKLPRSEPRIYVPEGRKALYEEAKRRDILSRLSEREQFILRKRYSDEDVKTGRELSRELGVSKGRIPQIETKAFAKIADLLREVH